VMLSDVLSFGAAAALKRASRFMPLPPPGFRASPLRTFYLVP
jgi:hypothetical protein